MNENAEDEPDRNNVTVTSDEATEEKVNVKDDEDAMVAADGHIVIPNCLCQICHRWNSNNRHYNERAMLKL